MLPPYNPKPQHSLKYGRLRRRLPKTQLGVVHVFYTRPKNSTTGQTTQKTCGGSERWEADGKITS
jgi:hypothetical protein